MSSFEPCSSPAWQAPVCDDQSVSHFSSRWLPSRSQALSVGALPLRIARCSTSCASPSISRKSTPGTSVSITPPAARRAWRATTLRYQESSSSIASRACTIVVSAVTARARTTPAPMPLISAPGLIAAASVISSAVEQQRRAAERDRRQPHGEAREQRPEQGVERAGEERRDDGPEDVVDLEPGQDRAQDEQRGGVDHQDDGKAQRQPGPGRHGADPLRRAGEAPSSETSERRREGPARLKSSGLREPTRNGCRQGRGAISAAP